MAIVYLADDRELDRVVAVKRLADNLADDRAFRDRFLREAQLGASSATPMSCTSTTSATIPTAGRSS